MQYTSIQTHPGAANQNQMKFRIRDYRVGSELHQSCEDFETRIAIRLHKAWWHLPWNWPEPRLLKAQMWKLGHGYLSQIHYFGYTSAYWWTLEFGIHFTSGFVSFYFLQHFPQGGINHSHLERNPLLCRGPTRGCVLPKNAQQSDFKDPTWLNSALTFFCKVTTWLRAPLTHSDSFGEQTAVCKILGHFLTSSVKIIILHNVIRYKNYKQLYFFSSTLSWT